METWGEGFLPCAWQQAAVTHLTSRALTGWLAHACGAVTMRARTLWLSLGKVNWSPFLPFLRASTVGWMRAER